MSDNHYTTLGLTQQADLKEIKKAYHQLALKHHPDKKGDASVFDRISSAYEVLSDPFTRQRYDQSLTPLFRQFFSKSLIHTLKVELSEVYTGTVKTLSISQSVSCSTCQGLRSWITSVVCQRCKGLGVIQQFSRIVRSQLAKTCEICQGSGLAPRTECVDCNGLKKKQISTVVEVVIKPGMKTGDRLFLAKDGLELMVELQCQPHPFFQRKGNHLVYQKQITVIESLAGLIFKLVHLDGRELTLQSEASDVLPPGSVRIIEKEGFPVEHGTQGDLHIQFEVVWPEPSDTTTLKMLKDLFKNQNPADMGALFLKKVDIREEESEKAQQSGCNTQ